MRKILKEVGSNATSSIVVFFVALPLCLGIAQASNPNNAISIIPIFSGIIAGIIGGVVVGLFSGSALSVSGPAAGLTATVSAAIVVLGNDTNAYPLFLLSVVLAGVIQILLGFLKAGFIGDYLPNSVIKGMLAAIGILLILKQFPHLIGEDTNPEGDESFFQIDKKNTFTAILSAIGNSTPHIIIIGTTCLGLQIFLESKWAKKIKALKTIPAALLVVIVGVAIKKILESNNVAVETQHLVTLPASKEAFWQSFTFPNFNGLTNHKVYVQAFTIAIIASLETLLGIEAIDNIDPKKRITPTNQELKAQGAGNIVSGLLGGLPITSVIVRSSANVYAGATTKMSAILHGILLFLMVLFFPNILNQSPLAALAAILIFTGYKLAKIAVFKEFYKKGLDQFIPFVVTIIAILLTDLLKGIAAGLLVGFFSILKSNFTSCVFVINDKENYLLRFRKDVSFLNKPSVKKHLNNIPKNAYIIIDATKADFIDKDIIDEVNSFIKIAPSKNIIVEVKKSLHKPMHLLFTEV
jgi:MFS superfamily sulfate permease-like transporter